MLSSLASGAFATSSSEHREGKSEPADVDGSGVGLLSSLSRTTQGQDVGDTKLAELSLLVRPLLPSYQTNKT